MAKRFTKGGLNVLGYRGVSSVAPPDFLVLDRAPRNTTLLGPIDYEHNIGTLWLDTSTDDMWILSNKRAGTPTWVRLTEVYDNVLQIDTDSGTAYPNVDGEITISGGAETTTAGVGNNLSITMGNGTNGQLLIASTTGDTQWATIASTPTITVTTGANTINIESTVAKAFDTLTGDTGTATAVAGTIDIAGGSNIFTTATLDTVNIFLEDPPDIAGTLTLSLLASTGVMMSNSSGLFSTSSGTDGQVLISGGTGPIWKNLISGDASVTITNGPNSINLETASVAGLSTFTADDTNTATPTIGRMDILGDGVSINTSAGGDTLLVALDSNPTIAGTLTLSPLTTAGVLSTNGSGVVTSSRGNDGQILIGGGTAPAWRNITQGTNITVTNGPNSINIETSASSPTSSESFMAYQPSNYVISAGSTYSLGAITVLTESFDTGSNFYPGDGAGSDAYYTAPVDGIYYFMINLQFNAVYITPAPPPPINRDPLVMFTIETTDRSYIYRKMSLMSVDDTMGVFASTSTVLSAGDTVKFSFRNDFDDPDYNHYLTGNATDAYTFVAGYLITAL